MTRSAAWAVVAACGVAGGATASVASCIPDLPSEPPHSDAGVLAAPAGYCGDGYIDPAAGEECDPGVTPGDAGIAGCTATCKVDCSGGWIWPNNLHCYQAIGTAWSAKNPVYGFQPATNLCQARGPGNAHVVTFASDEEFQAVTGALDAGTFWVGLSLGTPGYASFAMYEPGWSTSCSGCFARTVGPDAGLTPYLDGSAPADAGPVECVIASSQPQQPWQQYPCALTPSPRRPSPVSVICEFEPVGRRSMPCEAGTCIDLAVTHGSKRYVYQERAASADQAEAACSALHGHLVVLQSSDEREQLWRELSQVVSQPREVWIGLAQVGGTPRQRPTWQWDDNQPAQAYASEWGDLQPTPRSLNPALATTTTRAYLQHASPVSPAPYDDTLAHNDNGSVSMLPYVCQIPVP